MRTHPRSTRTDKLVPDTTLFRYLGGSSSVNGMIYNRGQAADFDNWAQLGNHGWSYADVLPYFRRTERWMGEGDDQYRGREGRLAISTRSEEHTSELQSLMRISYAVFCLKQKITTTFLSSIL